MRAVGLLPPREFWSMPCGRAIRPIAMRIAVAASSSLAPEPAAPIAISFLIFSLILEMMPLSSITRLI